MCERAIPAPARSPGRQSVNRLEQPEQLSRLGQFRARNPGVTIQRDAGFGFWQAWIPVSNGGTVITRYPLQDLLDKLEELFAPEPSHDSGGSGISDETAGPGTDYQEHAR
jgi:hypothetical protein